MRKVRRPLTCFCLFICSKGDWGSIGRYFVLQTETILIHDGPIHLAFLKRGARPWSPCRHAKRGIHPYFHLLVSLLGRCGFNALARDVGTGILQDHSWWMDQAFIVMDDNRLIPVESGKKHRSTHAHRYTKKKRVDGGSFCGWDSFGFLGRIVARCQGKDRYWSVFDDVSEDAHSCLGIWPLPVKKNPRNARILWAGSGDPVQSFKKLKGSLHEW